MRKIKFYKLKDFPRYEISKCGIVRNIKTGRVMVDKPCKVGYHRLWLSDKSNKRKGVSLHRLLAITFISGRTRWKNEVNHIDGNKSNNSLDNLEWVDRKTNMAHAKNVLKVMSGRKRKDLRRRVMKDLKAIGYTNYEIADAFEISQPRVVQYLK